METTRNFTKYKRINYIIIGILITLFFSIYLANGLDWKTLRGLMSGLQWKWFTAGLAVYFANIIFRAIRFKKLIYSRSLLLIQLIPISALHNLLMYLMPAKSGDISYVYLTKKRLNLPVPEGAATLLAVRIFDLGTVILLLATILPFSMGSVPIWIYQSALAFIVFGALAIIIIMAYVSREPSSHIKIQRQSKISIRIFETWDGFIEGLQTIKNSGSSRNIFLITLAIWVCIYTNNFLIAKSLGVDISYMEISIISMIMIPLTLLPFQGFANTATHELGWVSVMMAFGHSQNEALIVAVGSHFLLLISILLVTGISYFIAIVINKINEYKSDYS